MSGIIHGMRHDNCCSEVKIDNPGDAAKDGKNQRDDKKSETFHSVCRDLEPAVRLVSKSDV